MLKRRLITGPSPQNPTHTQSTPSFNYYVEFNTRIGVNQNMHTVKYLTMKMIYKYILKLIICWLKIVSN